jgi:hypothetical protein
MELPPMQSAVLPAAVPLPRGTSPVRVNRQGIHAQATTDMPSAVSLLDPVPYASAATSLSSTSENANYSEKIDESVISTLLPERVFS